MHGERMHPSVDKFDTDPSVTIIAPLYNRVYFLPQLFATLKGQGYGNMQLIVIDDGSTYGTGDWIEERQNKLGYQLLLLSQENQGQYTARKIGTPVPARVPLTKTVGFY